MKDKNIITALMMKMKGLAGFYALQIFGICSFLVSTFYSLIFSLLSFNDTRFRLQSLREVALLWKIGNLDIYLLNIYI